MTKFEVLSLLISLVGVIMIPLLVMAFRGMIKWTKTELQLAQVALDLAELIRDKDRVHREMLDQMKEDRHATNERLTWLEQNLWSKRRI